MALVAHDLRRDAVAIEEQPCPAGVLAEHDVGLAELAQDPERHVLEIPDRRGADDEWHVSGRENAPARCRTQPSARLEAVAAMAAATITPRSAQQRQALPRLSGRACPGADQASHPTLGSPGRGRATAAQPLGAPGTRRRPAGSRRCPTGRHGVRDPSPSSPRSSRSVRSAGGLARPGGAARSASPSRRCSSAFS